MFPSVSVHPACVGTYSARVGEWIQVRRDEIGEGVADLASTIGRSVKTVNNVESGRT